MPPLIDLDSAATSAPRMRASDADRLATVKQLQDAVARGLLTPDEGGERMADAFAAVHLTDLDPLTEDLPPAPPERTAPGWRSLGVLAVEQVRTSLTTAATGRLNAARVAVVLLVASLFLVLVGALSGVALSDSGGGGGDGGWHEWHEHRDHHWDHD
ncbi:DUF1707 SHOCT-like domain-containing protein [Geodermatophilus obscurus]|uniref:DUF1707 domain-containing protein n=1 Tax=Geodermatophilus obscurus (strain ATCC 25078 / DSM 43160 / JCM 3152 / CCUG 61914 / KCC A-0152 / KCTC 9177 / NBRC 13315 / NRRL B-3577 / G-20) TaxID=526225 RepID=D2SC27_GEOOG|nr:DUF1707 domain-containing protein [Geodermatophilus obscurus]ADB74195.1 protein of unknown function DUF1707 [Geodermatophilus obscurus DSM 43160]